VSGVRLMLAVSFAVEAVVAWSTSTERGSR